MKVERVDNNLIFTLEGDINLRNIEKIKTDIIDILHKDNEYQNVSINLEHVTFLDSSGLGMLVYVNRFLHSRQKVLHLISPSPDILEILRLGAFDKLFKIENQ